LLRFIVDRRAAGQPIGAEVGLRSKTGILSTHKFLLFEDRGPGWKPIGGPATRRSTLAEIARPPSSCAIVFRLTAWTRTGTCSTPPSAEDLTDAGAVIGSQGWVVRHACDRVVRADRGVCERRPWTVENRGPPNAEQRRSVWLSPRIRRCACFGALLLPQC
jgi:hypothetical protein